MAQRAFLVGLGPVGLASAVCLAELGCHVSVYDEDARRLNRLLAAGSSSSPPALIAAFIAAMHDDRIMLSKRGHSDTPIDLAFVCVGTPLKPDGRPAINRLRRAILELVSHTPGDFPLVLKSVPPPGRSLTSLQAILTKWRTPTRRLPVIINPDFLPHEHTIEDILSPGRIVIGADDTQDAYALAQLYAPLHCPTLLVSPSSAQFTKYAANAFFAAKIAFMNEIASLARRHGADVRSIAESLALDPRIGPDFIEPGLNYGEDGLPKEVCALERLVPDTLPGMLHAICRANIRQCETIIKVLQETLGTLVNKTICILGLGSQADDDENSDVNGFAIVDALYRGGARVRAYTPRSGFTQYRARLTDERLQHYDDAYQASIGADALIITNDWPEFQSLDWAGIANRLGQARIVVDGRNLLDAESLRALGLCFIPLS